MKRFFSFLLIITGSTAIGLALYVNKYASSPLHSKNSKKVCNHLGPITGWNTSNATLQDPWRSKNFLEKKLNLEDYAYKVYTKNDKILSIYIAHWNQGAMPLSLVQVHNPDNCWITSGWKTQKLDNSFDLNSSLGPGKYRLYKKDNKLMNVAFWHFVDEENYKSQGLQSTQYSGLLATLRHGFKQKKEQYFIRIASNTPFEVLEKDPGFIMMKSNIAQLVSHNP